MNEKELREKEMDNWECIRLTTLAKGNDFTLKGEDYEWLMNESLKVWNLKEKEANLRESAEIRGVALEKAEEENHKLIAEVRKLNEINSWQADQIKWYEVETPKLVQEMTKLQQENQRLSHGLKLHATWLSQIIRESERYKAALQEISEEAGTPYADIANKALEGDTNESKQTI